MSSQLKGRALLAGVVACIIISAPRVTVAAESYEFSIPAQSLADSLRAVGSRAGVNVAFDPASVQARRAPLLQGSYSVSKAFEILLEGSGLHVRTTDGGSFLIEDERPGAGMRISSGDGMTSRSGGLFSVANPGQINLAQVSVEEKTGDASSMQVDERKSSSEMQEVTVSAAPYRFLDADTSGTTNLPLPIEKVPQSITLLSSDFMRVTGVRTQENLDDYVAGMSDAGEPASGLTSRQYIRGFRTGSLYSRYVDGLPVPNYIGVYPFFDRVEIVKGPSSVTYGIATAGGLYNFVPKRAPKTFSARLAGEVGSWSQRNIEAEAGGPLNDTGSIRAIGAVLYDAGNSFVHHVDHEQTAGYAALEYSAERFSGSLRATHNRPSATGNDGQLAFFPDGTPTGLPRSFFMGDPDRNREDVEETLLNGNLDFAATNQLSLKAKASYFEVSHDEYLAYTSGFPLDDGTYYMFGDADENSYRTFSASLGALWWFPVFGREGSFFSAAATYIKHHASSSYYEIDFHGSENNTMNFSEGEEGLYGKVRQWTVGAPYSDSPYIFETESKIVSVQSLIKLTDRLSALAGSSISDPLQRSWDASAPAVNTTDFDREASLRGGLTYEFSGKSNVYVSYSESFEPQDLRDENRNLLPPLEGIQWEIGVKSRQRNGALLLAAAAYQLEQRNDARYINFIPGIGQIFSAVGKVRHKGVELEATGLVTPSITIMGAATYLDAKVAEDTDPALIGTRRTFIPRYTASLFAVKGFDVGLLKGFNVGGGVRYVGKQATTFDNSTLPVDGYTVMDLIAGYRSSRWSAQLSLNNILDKAYVQGKGYQSIWKTTWGDPRNASLRVSWDFGGAR